MAFIDMTHCLVYIVYMHCLLSLHCVRYMHMHCQYKWLLIKKVQSDFFNEIMLYYAIFITCHTRNWPSIWNASDAAHHCPWLVMILWYYWLYIFLFLCCHYWYLQCWPLFFFRISQHKEILDRKHYRQKATVTRLNWLWSVRSCHSLYVSS